MKNNKKSRVQNFNTAISKGRPSGKPSGGGSKGPAKGVSTSRPGDSKPKAGSGGGHVTIPKEWRVISGTHAIIECLRTRPRSMPEVWIKKGWQSSAELKDLESLCRDNKVHLVEREGGLLDRINVSNQGALGFSTQTPQFDLAKITAKEQSIVLILDGLEDPHNLGAILRTSWLLGIDGIVIPQDRAVGLTPSVHKVACGGVEHVPVLAVTQFSNVAQELKDAGYWIFGLAAEGKSEIYDLDLPKKVAWIIGSEEKGMRKPTERLCDELARIPQISEAASYNASVAAAIALSETVRQRKIIKN